MATKQLIQLVKSKLAFNHSESVSLGIGASVTLLLKCPAASQQFIGAFLDVTASASQNGEVRVFEAPTTSADGSARTPECLNRLDTPLPCSVAVSAGPTVTDDGTELERGIVGLSARYETSEPWLLKPGTNYLVRLSNTSGVASTVVLSVGLGIIPSLDYLLKL
jgi:hypothetical protein